MSPKVGQNLTAHQISKAIINDPKHKLQTPELKKEYEIGLKSLSSEQLFAAMKGKPKPDRMIFGLIRYTRSEDFKTVAKHLDEFKTRFAELADKPLMHLGKMELKELKQILSDAQIWANEYMITHWEERDSKPDKMSRIMVMDNLKKTITTQMNNLDDMLENKRNFSKEITIGDAFIAENSGIKKHDLVSNAHRKKELLDHQVLGQGQINTVTIAKFEKSDETVEIRVLKPITKEIKTFGHFEDLVGLDPTKPKMLERNLASAGVANLLGLGSMLEKPLATPFNGAICLDMPLAEGEPPRTQVRVPLGRLEVMYTSGLNAIEMYKNDPLNSQAKKNEFDNFVKRNGIVNEGNDEFGKPILTRLAETQLNLPYASTDSNELTANLQKALMDLQVLDALTGQVDRHSGNFFIKVTGNEVRLTAIDNDASFGENADHPVNTLDKIEGDFQQWSGLPPVMTRKTADMLVALTPEKLRETLQESGLEVKEIDLSLQRLTKLKEHVGVLENKNLITDDFLNFSIKDTDSDTKLSMSDFLTQKPVNGSTSNYVYKAVGVQQQMLNDGIPLAKYDGAPIDPEWD